MGGSSTVAARRAAMEQTALRLRRRRWDPYRIARVVFLIFVLAPAVLGLIVYFLFVFLDWL